MPADHSHHRSVRERILDATLTVIAQAGVDGVTHRRVAAEAGVSLGSTTRHFASREDMIRDAFVAYMDVIQADVTAMKTEVAASDSNREVADLIARWSYSVTNEVAAAEYELLVFAHRDRELADRIRVWHAVLDGVVAATLETRGVPRPLAGARALRSMLRGSELDRLSTGDVDRGEIVDRLELVLDALTRTTDQGDPS